MFGHCTCHSIIYSVNIFLFFFSFCGFIIGFSASVVYFSHYVWPRGYAWLMDLSKMSLMRWLIRAKRIFLLFYIGFVPVRTYTLNTNFILFSLWKAFYCSFQWDVDSADECIVNFDFVWHNGLTFRCVPSERSGSWSFNHEAEIIIEKWEFKISSVKYLILKLILVNFFKFYCWFALLEFYVFVHQIFGSLLQSIIKSEKSSVGSIQDAKLIRRNIIEYGMEVWPLGWSE